MSVILHTEEKQALASFDEKKHYLAVEFAGDKRRIVVLNRSEISCFDFFLQFFGFGKLANLDLHLSTVAHYLADYEWGEGVREAGTGSLIDLINQLYVNVTGSKEQFGQERAAYLTACKIAGKCLLKKGEMVPMMNLSQRVENRTYQVMDPKTSKKEDFLTSDFKYLYINPTTNVAHLKQQVCIAFDGREPEVLSLQGGDDNLSKPLSNDAPVRSRADLRELEIFFPVIA